MKNLLIIIVILFLSCTSEDNSRANLGLEFVKKTANSDLNSDLNSEADSEVDSSELIRTVLYKGTMNESIGISLYLKEQGNPCGGRLTMINGMYKYDTQEKWLLLEVSTDKQKEKYCLVEDNFTGVLFLEENGATFNGSWISPDTKKQFKVELNKTELDNETNSKLDEILFDDLIYNKYDC